MLPFLAAVGADSADATDEAITDAWPRSRAARFGIEPWEVDDPSSRSHIAIIAIRDPT
jgi:hypothetical protein